MFTRDRMLSPSPAVENRRIFAALPPLKAVKKPGQRGPFSSSPSHSIRKKGTVSPSGSATELLHVGFPGEERGLSQIFNSLQDQSVLRNTSD